MDWNERYAQDDTPWVKQAPHPAFVSYFAGKSDLGTVLVPGCGFGHDAGFLAETYAFSTVAATDISPLALQQAKETFPAVHFFLSDFLHEGMPTAYDWVCEHTLFCAIDPALREKYVAAVAQAVKRGGYFFAIFYLETGNPKGEGPPFRSEPEELDCWFAGEFSLEASWVPEKTFPGREGNEQVRLYRRA